MEERTFGWRQLLGAVNLGDFARMVAAELAQIGTSIRLATEALGRLPSGPLLFVAAMLIVLLRSLLLVLVTAVFGPAILIISTVRGISRRRPEER